MLLLAYICWGLSVTTGNYSWTDRIWSLTPVLYIYIFASRDLYSLATGNLNVEYRLVVMFILTVIWGQRLTYFFYRKGGYNLKSEDYRWPELRKIIPFPIFQLFNIVFIALYQNVLLLLISLPAYYIHFFRLQVPWGVFDYAVLVFLALFNLGEFIADQQQWNFQCAKRKKARAQQNFLTTGLFKYSRHPNFFCEQMIWICIFAFSVPVSLAKENSYFNWSGVGAVLLVLLFQGSTTFTETLSLKKYPEYAQYQQRTSRLIPWWPSKAPLKSKKAN